MTALKSVTAIAAFLALMACERPPHAAANAGDSMTGASMENAMSDGDSMMESSN